MNYLELLICSVIGAVLAFSVFTSTKNIVDKFQDLPSPSLQIEEVLNSDFSSFELDFEALF